MTISQHPHNCSLQQRKKWSMSNNLELRVHGNIRNFETVHRMPRGNPFEARLSRQFYGGKTRWWEACNRGPCERVRIPIIPGHATERVFSVDPFVAPKKNTKGVTGREPCLP